MKQKKKLLLGIGTVFGVVILVTISTFLSKGDTDIPAERVPVGDIGKTELSTADKGKYANLVLHDYDAPAVAVEELYNLEIQFNDSYQERTFLENFAIMNEVIDKFFMEDFDKSYIVADFYPPNEDRIDVYYNDIEKVCADEKYNLPEATYLFGNNTSEGGYMVQIQESIGNVWFSKNAFGSIGPLGSGNDRELTVYPYISCVRQVEDVEINLQDGKIKLSEMEARVLSFLNENFPMEVSENISFGIGDARILENGDYEGVCFKVRRIYKEIPFEYGSNISSDIYRDELGHDSGEITYAVSTSPDTMLTFGWVDGTIVETEVITEILTLDKALSLLSEEIGENSVYDVYGTELVYRECEIPEERVEEVDAILKPVWKIITINQNDDHYTLFYVDVVTGEITERFEYYYE